MVLKQSIMAGALRGRGDFKRDPFHMVPQPDLQKMRASGAASVDLRLGRWFSILRGTRHLGFAITEHGDKALSIDTDRPLTETDLTHRQFVQFNKMFILHPGTFALGATLEWIKIPKQCAGTIVGKSSWGRRGLIIETAPTVHPGFSGCLTLELTNVGHMPIALRPGMQIAQLMLHRAEGKGTGVSSFDGLRRPALGNIRLDQFTKTMMIPIE